MRKRNSPILQASVCLGTLAAGAGSASAQLRPTPAAPFDAPTRTIDVAPDHWHGVPIPVDATNPGVLAGAEHVITFQCGDGGFGWPHTACPTITIVNLTGAIGCGLLRVWETTGDADVLAAAVDGGDYDLAATFPDTSPAFGSFGPAFLHKLSGATTDGSYSSHAATGFFDALTAGTYGDPGSSVFYPADTYDYLDRHKSIRTGTSINLRPWDMHMMPWVAGLIGNADSATPADGITQSGTFLNDAVLDGLDTLEEGVQWDLLGLAGAVRGLALNGTTTFPAISAPLFDDIVGITMVCDLADVLASFQNASGSWSWVSTMQDPVDPTDQDTQTTAYAVLALMAADDLAGCTLAPGGRYNSEIAAGRAWLETMQDGTGGYASYPTGPHNIAAEAEAMWAAAVAPLSLTTASCENSGTVVVDIDMATMPDDIVGGQFFLEYDDTVLTFVSADPGDAPFTVEVFELTAPGSISYAVGVPGGGPGTDVATTMARITFSTDMEVCTPTADLVTWNRMTTPSNRLSNEVGDETLPTLLDLSELTIDETPPSITPPSPISVNADAGGCDAAVTVPALVASDTCSGVASIVNDYTGTSDASDIYPSGLTTITWTVTDDCGNVSMTTQDITVEAVNDLDVAVSLMGVSASVTRCVTFELIECAGAAPTAWVTADLAFVGGSFVGTIEVPCGSYTCATARDALHTLRRSDDDDFGIVGAVYVADFSPAGTTDQSLVGGNLNGDIFIDILDFGIFVGQFGMSPGGSTPCTPSGPHADIDGDGNVFASDFTFISLNFLETAEADCCTVDWALASSPPHAGGPVWRVTTAQLKAQGMGELTVADLNADGWLDTRDMQAFLEGARP